MTGDPQRHRKLVGRALERAAARRDEGAPQPDDVLAVEVRRLLGLLDRRDDAITRYRKQAEELLAAEATATTRMEEWRERALAAEREGRVDPEEVKRLRSQVAAFRGVVADRDAQLVELRGQLADADARKTTGGRIRPHTHRWANLRDTPAPDSSTDETAPPLQRGDLGPAVRVTAPAGEEL